MMRDRRLLLLVLLTFAAAIAGVVIGRVYVVPVRPVENELHDLLHRDLKLDTAQHSRLETIEKNYAIRRQALEAELRADNARLAEAIEAEHGYGPRVAGRWIARTRRWARCRRKHSSISSRCGPCCARIRRTSSTTPW